MGRTTWVRRMTTGVTVVTMASFGLTTVASAQTITTTGPGSVNRIDSRVRNNCTVTNHNNVSVHTSNYQGAQTGNATVSDNTTAGASWGGWASLNPSAAQANGTSYAAWRDGVTSWVGNHSSGAGWNSNQDNLTWVPSGNDWNSYDPVIWQANGQSFANWWNGVESYLNANSSNLVLNWPKTATGGGSFGGASSGNATNNNNSSFAIRINNSARALAGTNACGQSNFTPPPTNGGGGSTGGKGGGPAVVTTASAPQGNKGGKGGVNGGAGGFGGFASATPHGISASAAHPSTSNSSPGSSGSSSQPPSGGQGGGMTPPGASISNTGPGSKNTVTSQQSNNTTVTNTNNVAVCNTSSQSASSGNATVSGNTNAGSGGSGYSSNGNGTGLGADLTN